MRANQVIKKKCSNEIQSKKQLNNENLSSYTTNQVMRTKQVITTIKK